MMNALYHGPGLAKRDPRDLALRSDLDPITIQFGSSGDTFGLCVRDEFGSLSRARAVEYLGRAADSKSQIEDKRSGAGLGLITVMKLASELQLTVRPGSSTEVLALFDMRGPIRGPSERSVLRITGEHGALEEPDSLPGPLEDATVTKKSTAPIFARSRAFKKAVRSHAPQR
jgi:hypothetical protein